MSLPTRGAILLFSSLPPSRRRDSAIFIFTSLLKGDFCYFHLHLPPEREFLLFYLYIPPERGFLLSSSLPPSRRRDFAIFSYTSLLKEGRVLRKRLYEHTLFFSPLYTGRIFHCYVLNKFICHFRGLGSVLLLLFYF